MYIFYIVTDLTWLSTSGSENILKYNNEQTEISSTVSISQPAHILVSISVTGLELQYTLQGAGDAQVKTYWLISHGHLTASQILYQVCLRRLYFHKATFLKNIIFKHLQIFTASFHMNFSIILLWMSICRARSCFSIPDHPFQSNSQNGPLPHPH